MCQNLKQDKSEHSLMAKDCAATQQRPNRNKFAVLQTVKSESSLVGGAYTNDAAQQAHDTSTLCAAVDAAAVCSIHMLTI
jgi:hypothetical protein